MSERSLRNWFKTYTGQKISQYVSSRRAEYAARIFRLFPDTSKSEVSRIIGLSNTQSLYPFMRKNGIVSIDELRDSPDTTEFELEKFRYDQIPDSILFYTMQKVSYTECSTAEYEIKNWGEIESYISSNFSEAIKIGDVGFAIDGYVENKTEEGMFISGILCKNIRETQLKHDIIGDIGWRFFPAQKYAVFTHIGDYANLTGTYFSSLCTLQQKSIKIAKSLLIMEKYLNSPINTAPEKLITEIWIPV